MTRAKKPRWTLVDADPIAVKHKDTFDKVSRQLISRVCPGDFVLLIFQADVPGTEPCNGERMWAVVEERLKGAEFRGRLRNDPFVIGGLKFDDLVSFAACHIVDIDWAPRPARPYARQTAA